VWQFLPGIFHLIDRWGHRWDLPSDRDDVPHRVTRYNTYEFQGTGEKQGQTFRATLLRKGETTTVVCPDSLRPLEHLAVSPARFISPGDGHVRDVIIHL
jgi:hypothetical protein